MENQTDGLQPVLRDNVIVRAPVGVSIGIGVAPVLEGNRIDVEGTALEFDGASGTVLSGNTICGGKAIATYVAETSLPSLVDNEICEVAAAG